MNANLKKYLPLLMVLFTVAPQAFAQPTDGVRYLPFGDGPLFAMSVACVLVVAWVLRARKK